MAINSRKQEIMIEPNQSRLDDFDNLNDHSEPCHRGHLDTQKE